MFVGVVVALQSYTEQFKFEIHFTHVDFGFRKGNYKIHSFLYLVFYLRYYFNFVYNLKKAHTKESEKHVLCVNRSLEVDHIKPQPELWKKPNPLSHSIHPKV
jgi:hypothetical protein